ncbi:MAG: ROK family protein [Candidatus Competibacterales bacterium]
MGRDIDPTAWRIGIDLGGTKIEGILMDGEGLVRARQRIPTPRGDYPQTLGAMAQLVAALEGRGGGPARVGVAMPGALDPPTGLVKNANSTWLIGRPLDRDLEVLLRRPVRVANDADCFALSEAVDGAAEGYPVVFGVILGTGVGGGIVVRGQLLRGPNAIAGEWGHNPLPWPGDDERPGPVCYCGLRGCIETWLSGPGLARDHGQRWPTPTTAEAIAAAATQGDKGALDTLGRYEERLARALATVINQLDPHAIVLGGGLSKLVDLYRRVPQLWRRWVFSPDVATALLPPRHGDASGVRGAAWLWPPTSDDNP